MININEMQAIDLAKAYLGIRFPRVITESTISADCISGTTLTQQRYDYEQFLGVDIKSISNSMLAELGLDEQHWSVKFFPINTREYASTVHATIVRVYDDGRVFLVKD